MDQRVRWKGTGAGKYVPAILVLLGFLYRLFFIRADIFLQPSQSAAAVSDPGLDAEPVRNLWMHGVTNLCQSGTLLKGPALSFLWLLLTPFCAHHYLVAKIIFLCLLTVGFLWLSLQRATGIYFALLFLLAAFHPLLGDFLPLPLGEWLSLLCILFSLASFGKGLEKEGAFNASIFKSVCWMMLATLFKVQYAYTLFIPPLAALVFLPFLMLVKQGRDHVLKIAAMLLLAVGFVLLMYGCWWLPNAGRFSGYYAHQEAIRFNLSAAEMQQNRQFWKIYYFYQGPWHIYRIVYKATLVAALVFLFLPLRVRFRKELAFLLVWNLLEWQKFNFHTLPERYLLGLFVAGLLLMLFVCAGLWDLLRWYSLPLILGLAWMPLQYQAGSLLKEEGRQTYSLEAAQQRLKKRLKASDVVLGGYAATLAWDAGVETHYINDTITEGANILQAFQPAYILCDTSEEEIGGAFRRQRVSLHRLASAVDTLKVNYLTLVLYRVNPAAWKAEAAKHK